MSGLTDTGFESKTLEELILDLQSKAVAEFGPALRLDNDSVAGHLIGIMSEGLFELWELAQLTYDWSSPDNASGAVLDNLSGIVGVVREPATKASGTATLYGNDGTVVPAGSIVAASTLEGAQFVTLADATIGESVSGEVDVSIEAEEAGALVVLASEVDTIITPVSGWTSVDNASDLSPGEDVESDSELRLRREESLAIIGSGTDNAIRSKVAALDDVDFCKVISNRTLSTDSYGIPPKAFRTVIWPNSGVDEERVASVIFENMPAGIEPDGAVSYDVTDEQGITQTVSFSYATEVAIGVEVDVTTDVNFPADGTTQIENAILAVAASEFTVGADVRTLSILCAVNEVPGVVTAVLRLDKKPPFPPATGTSNIAITDTEIATLAASDIDVTEL